MTEKGLVRGWVPSLLPAFIPPLGCEKDHKQLCLGSSTDRWNASILLVSRRHIPSQFKPAPANHGTTTLTCFASLSGFAAVRSSRASPHHRHHPVPPRRLPRDGMSRLSAQMHDQTAVGRLLPKKHPFLRMASELPRCDRLASPSLH